MTAAAEKATLDALNAAAKGGAFDGDAFLDALTSKAVRGQHSRAAYDGGALAETLQRADAALRRRADAASGTQSAAAASAAHAAAVRRTRERAGELRDAHERLHDDFRGIDAAAARAAATAARVGERLDTLEQHRRRAADIVELLARFAQLNGGAQTPRDALFTDPTRLLELARAVRLLAPVARELDGPGFERGRREVERLAAHVETALLARFFDAENAGNAARMRETAAAMADFNGGDSLVARFIQSRALFTDAAAREADKALALSPPPPPSQQGSFRAEDARVAEFCNRVLRALQSENVVVQDVFPRPAAVMSLLVQKALELRVRPFIDAIVFRQQDVSKIEYVRTLHAAHATLNAVLFTGLRQFVQPAQLQVFADSFFANYLWPCSPDGKPHPSSYIIKELEAMTETYNEGLRTFDRKKRALEKLGLRSPQPGDQGAMPGEASDELVSIQTVLEFLHANEAAVARCVALSRKGDAAANVGSLFRLLLQFVFLEYSDDAVARTGKLAAAAVGASQQESVKPIHAVSAFLRLVQVATQVVVLVQRHYKEVIAPSLVGPQMANEATTCQEQLEQLTNSLETKVIAGLGFCVDTISVHVGKILSGQNKAAFRIRDDELSPDLKPTLTCTTAVRYLDAQRDVVTRCLDGRNVRSFLTEVAARLLRLLLDHIKHLTVTGAGALVLLRDISEYRECVGRFGSSAAVRQHMLLADVAKIFLVGPDNIRTLVEDSELSRLDPAEFAELVKARADYKSSSTISGWLSKLLS